MITLEKLLTELKAESLNEIVAAGGKCGSGGSKSNGHKNGKHGCGGGSSNTSGGCGSATTACTYSYSCS